MLESVLVEDAVDKEDKFPETVVMVVTPLTVLESEGGADLVMGRLELSYEVSGDVELEAVSNSIRVLCAVLVILMSEERLESLIVVTMVVTAETEISSVTEGSVTVEGSGIGSVSKR